MWVGPDLCTPLAGPQLSTAFYQPPPPQAWPTRYFQQPPVLRARPQAQAQAHVQPPVQPPAESPVYTAPPSPARNSPAFPESKASFSLTGRDSDGGRRQSLLPQDGREQADLVAAEREAEARAAAAQAAAAQAAAAQAAAAQAAAAQAAAAQAAALRVFRPSKGPYGGKDITQPPGGHTSINIFG